MASPPALDHALPDAPRARHAQALGEQLRRWRVRDGHSQEVLAGRAGVSDLSVRRLETGVGSTLETLLRVLQALGRLDRLDALLDPVAVSPMERVGRHTGPVARRARPRKRA